MKEALYQIFHPWHWLTYNQNAEAVAAVAAALALVGLFFYTRYTRKMMQMQANTTRASITPILVTPGDVGFATTDLQLVKTTAGAHQPIVVRCRLSLTVKNIGEGAALYVRGWCQPVSEKFVNNSSMILEKTAASRETDSFAYLQKSESTTIQIENLSPEIQTQRAVIVIEAIDVTSLRHQLQIIRSPSSDGKTDIAVTMAHADPLFMRKMKIRTQGS